MSGAACLLLGCFALAGAATVKRLARSRVVSLPFCTIALPSNWAERPTHAGHAFADSEGRRTLLVQELTYPRGQTASLKSVLNFIVDQTRENARHSFADLQLGSLSHQRSGKTVTASYGGQSRERDGTVLFTAVSGRPLPTGGFRFVSLHLESAGETNVVEALASGARMLDSLVISQAALSTTGSATTREHPVLPQPERRGVR